MGESNRWGRGRTVAAIMFRVGWCMKGLALVDAGQGYIEEGQSKEVVKGGLCKVGG